MKTTTINTITAILTALLLVGCSNNTDVNKANEFVERSQAYEQQGQYRAALIEMRNALQAQPNSGPFVVRYANLLTSIGSPNQAEEILKSVAGNEELTRLPLAEALLLQGKYISAKEVLAGWQQNSTEQNQYSRLLAL
ncbi:tetratricopeptide repeat protein, partial [Saccharospirillum sp. MSK14-1]|uniref:tetratricopeptide repeat protein n=1 Tax=Saccharospirillum sp. MSK14-1 TaxID=1897632 RepID=UPI0011B28052